MMYRKQGRLVRWNGSYGFIRYNGKDIFTHLTSFLHGFVPEQNSIVEFEIGPAKKEGKPNEAFRVIVVKSAAQVIAEFNEQNAEQLAQGGVQ